MHKISLLFTPLLTLLVSACSPHPSSGQWHKLTIVESEISMIDVMFDGKAQMYGADQKQIIRRCFWAGQDSKTIALTCVNPDNTDVDIKYQMRILDGQANLLQADQTIASFRKQ